MRHRLARPHLFRNMKAGDIAAARLPAELSVSRYFSG